MPAAGRNQVAYDDIGYDGITMKIDNSTIVYDETKVGGSAGVGLAVTWSADDTVALAADGDALVGKLILVHDDNFCTVAFRGFVSLPAGTGATVTRGRLCVGALLVAAKGYIRQATASTAFVTAEYAEQARARGRIWATADLTNVWVDFGA